MDVTGIGTSSVIDMTGTSNAMNVNHLYKRKNVSITGNFYHQEAQTIHTRKRKIQPIKTLMPRRRHLSMTHWLVQGLFTM
jgi:hypothetical protein